MMNKFYLILLSVIITLNVQSQTKIFQTNYKTALNKSRTNKKPVMIYFSLSENTNNLNNTDDLIIRNKSMASDLSEKYNTVFISKDNKQFKELSKKHNINFFPTYLFVNYQNKMIHKRIGLLDKREFSTMLKNVDNKTNTIQYFRKQEMNNSKKINYLHYADALYNAGMQYRSKIDKYFDNLEIDDYNLPENMEAFYRYADNVNSAEFLHFVHQVDYPLEKVKYTALDRKYRIEDVVTYNFINNIKNINKISINDTIKVLAEIYFINDFESFNARLLKDYYKDITHDTLKYVSIIPIYIETHSQALSEADISDYCVELLSLTNNEEILQPADKWMKEIIFNNKKIEYLYIDMQILVKMSKFEEAKELFIIAENEYPKQYNKEWRSKMTKLILNDENPNIERPIK